MPIATPTAVPAARRTTLSSKYAGRMPLAINVPNFWITSTGPGKNTGGKMPERAITAQSATTGTNGNSAVSVG